MLELGYSDAAIAEELWIMCSRDILFWVNTFCWLFEPRMGNSKAAGRIFPWLTWPIQDDTLLTFQEALNVVDIGVDKSRGTGVTWQALHLYYHGWQFVDESEYGVVSRTAEVVENPGNLGALMQKLDFIYDHQPSFLRPSYVDRAAMRFANPENNSSIMGSAATGHCFRGDRKLGVLLDEHGAFPPGDDEAALDATQYVSNSRLIVSTWTGDTGAFFDFMTKDDEQTPRQIVVVDWKDCPPQAAGLYTSKDGVVEILDKKFRGIVPVGKTRVMFPDEYPFILDGRIRSPYYDREEGRSRNKQAVARELDRNPHGAQTKPYDSEMLEKHRQLYAQEPLKSGTIIFDLEEFRPTWVPQDNGLLKLWQTPSPTTTYTIGADIAAGTGGSHSSNSVLFVIDNTTGEQVAEFATNTMRPTEFAQFAVALCWFYGGKVVGDQLYRGAYLIWEDSGPTGKTFKKEIVRIGYRNVYFRVMKWSSSEAKKTREPGWINTGPEFAAIQGESARAMGTGELKVRSSLTIFECGQYVYREGNIVHQGSRRTDDQSAKGKSHGDRSVAKMLAWLGREERKPGPPLKPIEYVEGMPSHELPPGSMARRLAEHEEKMAAFNESEWRW